MPKDMSHIEAHAVNLLKTLWGKPYLRMDTITDEKEGATWHTYEYFHTDSDNWDVVGIIIDKLYPQMTEQMKEHVWDRAMDIAEVIQCIVVFDVNNTDGLVDEGLYWRVGNFKGWFFDQMEANRHVALASLHAYE